MSRQNVVGIQTEGDRNFNLNGSCVYKLMFLYTISLKEGNMNMNHFKRNGS